MNTRLMMIHALSPVHCGTGQAVGGIDLPIAREKATQLPLIPGSSIKGVLRAQSAEANAMHRAVFGPDTVDAADHAGCVQFSDALLAFLPVRSLRGTFAWATAPFMLRRLFRDAREAGLDLGTIPKDPREDRVHTTGERLQERGKVVFEDLDFSANTDRDLKQLATKLARTLFCDTYDQELFTERVCLVNDDAMGLLLQSCTEIRSRIRIDPDKGTVARGALWTEEALPVESILFSMVAATPVALKNGDHPEPKQLLDHVQSLLSGSLQLGGHATVGRGLCRIKMVGG